MQTTYPVAEKRRFTDSQAHHERDNSPVTMTAMQRAECLVEKLHNPQAYVHPVVVVQARRRSRRLTHPTMMPFRLTGRTNRCWSFMSLTASENVADSGMAT